MMNFNYQEGFLSATDVAELHQTWDLTMDSQMLASDVTMVIDEIPMPELLTFPTSPASFVNDSSLYTISWSTEDDIVPSQPQALSSFPVPTMMPSLNPLPYVGCIYIKSCKKHHGRPFDIYKFGATTAGLEELLAMPYKYHAFISLKGYDPNKVSFKLKVNDEDVGIDNSVEIFGFCESSMVVDGERLTQLQIQFKQKSHNHSRKPLSIQVLYDNNVVLTTRAVMVYARPSSKSLE